MKALNSLILCLAPLCAKAFWGARNPERPWASQKRHFEAGDREAIARLRCVGLRRGRRTGGGGV